MPIGSSSARTARPLPSNVDPAPGRVDPYPESRLVAVPEHLVAALDGKGVYGSLAELDGAHGRVLRHRSPAVTLPNPSSTRKRQDFKPASPADLSCPRLRHPGGTRDYKTQNITACYDPFVLILSCLTLFVVPVENRCHVLQFSCFPPPKPRARSLTSHTSSVAAWYRLGLPSVESGRTLRPDCQRGSRWNPSVPPKSTGT